MNGELKQFYNIWELILSRQPEVIRKVFNRLDRQEKNAVLDHLHKMQSEPGWQPGQQESARVALDVILDPRNMETE